MRHACVQVLSNAGSGSTTGIIDALNWVKANTNGRGGNYPIGVVTMSLSSG